MSEHTISVRLENKPGALARVSQLFSRRGYNIQSLAVGPTEQPDISRLTLRVDCSEHSLEQIEKQMHKLVNVLRVTELRADEAVERELALITVAASPEKRPDLLQLAQVVGATVADIGRDAITFQVVGRPDEVDAFEELVRPVRGPRAGAHRPHRAPPPGRLFVPFPRPRRSLAKGAPVAEIIKSGDVGLLSGKVAVLGFGSQGHAHALNLHDSGVEVEVGLRPGSSSAAAAEEAGLAVRPVAEAVRGAQLVVFLVPDGAQPALYRDEVAPNLEDGAALVFAHGFNVHYGRIEPPAGHDVIMVAPKGPGHIVRRLYTEGYGTPAVVAVAQDASGQARELALAYGAAIGAARAGMVETTFAEETETDLFGEQSVLCGGVTQLIQMGFETLVEAGYQPEVAYYECLHELKLIVDLIWEGGIERMHYSISDTAEYGSHAVGPKVVDEHVRENMRAVLASIRDGSFAREWVAEMDRGQPSLEEYRQRLAETQIEQVGTRLRALNEREVAEVHGVG